MGVGRRPYHYSVEGGGSPLRKGKVLFDMAVAGWVTTAESLPPGVGARGCQEGP